MLLCTFQLNKSLTRSWKNLKTAILDYLIYFHLKADAIPNCYSINAELVKPNTTTTLIQYLMEPKNDTAKDN